MELEKVDLCKLCIYVYTHRELVISWIKRNSQIYRYVKGTCEKLEFTKDFGYLVRVYLKKAEKLYSL